jgi:hypothetical protein
MATNTSPVSVTPSMRDRTSSVLVRFTPSPHVSTEQYDESISRLEKLGNWPPAGLEYHVAFRSNGELRVSEIWDSREQLDAFGERLMPVLKDVGIELTGKPETLEIHNVVKR